MQSRNTISLATSLLLTAVACAYQNAGTGLDDPGEHMADTGGTLATGGTSATGGKTSLPLSGTTSTSTAGKTSSSGGTGTDLPPIGSSGKTSTGGTGGKTGTGGKGGSGGSMAAGGEDTGPVNMPIPGLSVTFAAASTSDPNDYMGGEVNVINDTAQPLSLSDLKIRYYFSNEVTAATPTVMMNYTPRFGPMSNLGDAMCTGTINKADAPAAGADSYVELTCSAASSNNMTAGMLLRISWKVGAGSPNKFIQANDWSFMDPTKIIILNGQTIVWGKPPS